MSSIDKPVRLINYIVDLFAITIIILVFTLLFPQLNSVGMSYLIFFGYYFIMESTTQRTLGKYMTRTIVIKKDGTKPSLLNILMRSFWRVIPIDVLSYLFGSENGMHDTLSSTRLKFI